MGVGVRCDAQRMLAAASAAASSIDSVLLALYVVQLCRPLYNK